MTKWELARYLIEAKKAVDSVIYIANNATSLTNIDLRDKVNSKRNAFYINCCVVLDKSFPLKKKELCNSDTIVQSLYYERDKNSAHKDENYKPKQYKTLLEIADDMKTQLSHVRDICNSFLPEGITLDFVSHDRELFRFVNGVTVEIEEAVNTAKYPLRNKDNNVSDGIVKKVFNDTEDIRDIEESERENFAVILENGINEYEGLQNRQDSCIKINVLFGLDMWCQINLKIQRDMNKLKDIGFINQFGIINPDAIDDSIILKQVDEILGQGDADD
jgi:hypothetical protein